MFVCLLNHVLCENDKKDSNIHHDNSIMYGVFWEVKPYIFKNKNGTIDGIFPMIFSQASRYCSMKKSKPNSTVMNFSYEMPSRRVYLNEFLSSKRRVNIPQDKDIWFPAMYRDLDPAMRAVEQKKDYKLFHVTTASEMAVIFPRSHISLVNKVVRGIVNCEQIFFITFLLAVFFGVLMWLFERLSHPSFPNSWLRGLGMGLWWSFTIGYGDIVPNSVPGRLTAVVWVAIAIMVASVMTASITESVTGTSDLNIRGKKVAVLENSFELDHIINDFYSEAVLASSYGDVIEKVRSGEAAAGAMNAEIAAWYVDDIQDDNKKNPLRIANKLPVNLYINILIPGNISSEAKQLFRCMHSHADEVYQRSIKSFKRYCPSETLYLDSISFIVQNNLFVQIIMIVIPVLTVIGAIMSCLSAKNEGKKESTKVICSGQSTVSEAPHPSGNQEYALAYFSHKKECSEQETMELIGFHPKS